jgi:hypothetical protein
MKKFIITSAFFFIAHFAVAQDAFKADVLKVIQQSGAAAPMQMAKEQVMEIFHWLKEPIFLRNSTPLYLLCMKKLRKSIWKSIRTKT